MPISCISTTSLGPHQPELATPTMASAGRPAVTHEAPKPFVQQAVSGQRRMSDRRSGPPAGVPWRPAGHGQAAGRRLVQAVVASRSTSASGSTRSSPSALRSSGRARPPRPGRPAHRRGRGRRGRTAARRCGCQASGRRSPRPPRAGRRTSSPRRPARPAGDYLIVQDARHAWRARWSQPQEPGRAGSKPGEAAALTVASSGAPTAPRGQRRRAR